MADEITRLIEFEDRRRRHAAFVSGLRRRRRADLRARGHRVVAAVHDPDVILRVDGNAGDGSEQPVVGKRLRPERIDLERRRRLARQHGGREREGGDGDRQSSLHLHEFLSDGPQYTLRRMRRWTLAIAAAMLALAPAPSSAHDIPASVVVQAFVRPQGDHLRLLVRVPLAAMRDVEFPLRDGGLLDLPRADRSLRDAAIAMAREGHRACTKATPRSARRRWPACACRCRPIARSRPIDSALAGVTGPPLAARHDAVLEPGDARRPVRVPDPVRPIDVLDPPGAGAARGPRRHRAALPASRGRGARVRARRRSRTRAARSAVASGGVAVRPAGLRAHPRRDRPPAVPVLPGDSVPPVPRARPRRDRVHPGPLDDAHRRRLRLRARRAVVLAARSKR